MILRRLECVSSKYADSISTRDASQNQGGTKAVCSGSGPDTEFTLQANILLFLLLNR